MINFQRHGNSAVYLRERKRQLGLGKLVEDTRVGGSPIRIQDCTNNEIIDKVGSLPKPYLVLALLHGTNVPILKPTDHVS